MGRKHAKQVLLLNDLEIGLLEYESSDNWWHYGRFYELPDFASVAELFARLERAWADDDPSTEALDSTSLNTSLALDVQDEVNSLDLRVRREDGSTEAVRDFKLDAGRYEFKYDHTLTNEA